MRTDEAKVIELIRNIIASERLETFALGTVPADYTTGLPTVKFDEETVASTKQRPHLSSYAPAANDRVMLAKVSNEWVIIGKVTS